MKTFKQTIVIFLVATLIVLAGLWLAETDWADSYRTNPADWRPKDRPRGTKHLQTLRLQTKRLYRKMAKIGARCLP